jgi:hypothetical protein
VKRRGGYPLPVPDASTFPSTTVAALSVVTGAGVLAGTTWSQHRRPPHHVVHRRVRALRLLAQDVVGIGMVLLGLPTLIGVRPDFPAMLGLFLILVGARMVAKVGPWELLGSRFHAWDGSFRPRKGRKRRPHGRSR